MGEFFGVLGVDGGVDSEGDGLEESFHVFGLEGGFECGHFVDDASE